LDSTIVWCGGEFGRTPKVQWEAPWEVGAGTMDKFSLPWLPGGGFKGGRVVGLRMPRGEQGARPPGLSRDLIASIYQQLGIDLKAQIRTARDRWCRSRQRRTKTLKRVER